MPPSTQRRDKTGGMRSSRGSSLRRLERAFPGRSVSDGIDIRPKIEVHTYETHTELAQQVPASLRAPGSGITNRVYIGAVL
jgi:hypothetical protein